MKNAELENEVIEPIGTYWVVPDKEKNEIIEREVGDDRVT